MSMLTGAFDSSPAIFLLYRMLYERFARISLEQWFLSYLIVPIFILLVQIFIMPAQSYKTASELAQQASVAQGIVDRQNEYLASHDSDLVRERQEHESMVSEIDALLGGPEGDQKRIEGVREKRKAAGVWGVMHGKPVQKQLTSFWFWGIAGFTIIQMTRINYFLATIRPQYEFLLHSYREAVKINHLFDIALPLGGLAAIPFIGVILDSLSTLAVLSILVTVATIIGILGLIECSHVAAYINILLFVLYRPFYYTVVSDYCAKVFGVATFGKVYGAVICLAGLFNFSQAGLDAMTYKLFGGDPRPTNLILLGAAATVGVALILFVRAKGRKQRKNLLKEEARQVRERGETQSLWPEGNGYGAV